MPRANRDSIRETSRDRLQAERQLKIRRYAVDTLRLDPLNPRQHSDKQIERIANSIRIFGFNVPVLIDGMRNVVAGHGRLHACKRLGITEVPTISLGHLSPQQLKAFMIADNRLSEISTWDEDLLRLQLKALAELDFSLEATGFETAEIDLLIEGMQPSHPAEPDPADELPAEAKIQVTGSGDLWQLGKHRVLCGDALDGEAYRRLLVGRQAGVVFADPPYNVPIDGHASGLGKKRHPDFAMASGEMTPGEFTDFLSNVCRLLAQSSREGSIHFICMDWRHMGELLAAGREAYNELKNLCVWTKSSAGMGSLYRSQHELVFVFKNGKESHRNNVQLGQFGRYRTNVWHYPGANTFGRLNEEGNLLHLHPTVKPVALVADAVMDCSARGEIVLDPFLGSGTSVIAAERTGRICCGMEIDATYIDVTVRRWQRFTGLKAKHALSGRSFDELEGEATQNER